MGIMQFGEVSSSALPSTDTNSTARYVPSINYNYGFSGVLVRIELILHRRVLCRLLLGVHL